MKKLLTICFLMSVVGLSTSLAQSVSAPVTATATVAIPADYFTGKWAITILGTPNGDALFHTTLNRKDGLLFGELVDPSGTVPPIAITKIDEKKESIDIYFSTQGYDVNVELIKVDDVKLKGTLMGMFETNAIRL